MVTVGLPQKGRWSFRVDQFAGPFHLLIAGSFGHLRERKVVPIHGIDPGKNLNATAPPMLPLLSAGPTPAPASAPESELREEGGRTARLR